MADLLGERTMPQSSARPIRYAERRLGELLESASAAIAPDGLRASEQRNLLTFAIPLEQR